MSSLQFHESHILTILEALYGFYFVLLYTNFHFPIVGGTGQQLLCGVGGWTYVMRHLLTKKSKQYNSYYKNENRSIYALCAFASSQNLSGKYAKPEL